MIPCCADSTPRDGRVARRDPGRSAILVAGLVRDCASQIASEVHKLAGALRGFRHVSWLLVESDSSDGTVASLRALEGRIEHFRFLSLGRLADSIPLRTQRLATCRNAYLHEIRSNPRYGAIDFVLIADLDGTNRLLTEGAIASCWRRDHWDVCTANQSGPYYDIWALRHSAWSPNDCWAQYRFLVAHGVSSEKALAVAVHSRMIRLQPDDEWIEVDSAFGGLAIYRRHALSSGEYSNLGSDGCQTCEHVALHAHIRANGLRIFVNPALINTDYTEHTTALFLRNKVVRVARRALSQSVRRERLL